MKKRLVKNTRVLLDKFVIIRNLHFTALCLFMLAVPACKRQPAEPDAAALARMFGQPPMEYRPYVWWHWMGPNFSQEGIRKDLEAMAEAGIGGEIGRAHV